MVLESLSDIPGFDELRGRGGLWLVGGAVRDVLLGSRCATSTSSSRATRSPSRATLGDVVAEHERFGTAEVRLARSGAKVNVAARAHRDLRSGRARCRT